MAWVSKYEHGFGVMQLIIYAWIQQFLLVMCK